MNDITSIKEALSKDEVNFRPKYTIFGLINPQGVLASWNGQMWKEQRRFALKTLRDLGFGRIKFEKEIIQEIQYLHGQIDKEMEETKRLIEIKRLLGPSVSNNVSLIVTGERFDFDHPMRKLLDSVFLGDASNDTFQVSSVGYLTHFPKTVQWLLKIVKLITSKPQDTLDRFRTVTGYVQSRVDLCEKKIDQENNLDEEDAENFMDAYLRVIRKTDSKDIWNIQNLHGCATSFFGAGSATIKDYLEWFLLVVAVYPELQDRLRAEVDSVIGRERPPSQADKKSMPFMEAMTAEVHRFSSQIALNLPHMASEDLTIGGYLIPKGTEIYANFYGANRDPNVWEEPEKFRPERFLSADGTKFIQNNNLIPFGYGKRSCPGESMAKAEIFLYVTSIIQKYIISHHFKKEVNLDAKILFFSLVPKVKVELYFDPRK